ncbi:MAG: acyltransferase [Rhodocyclaceae bacterium]|nr:acyltransferase [Rhodocyclaceae bacterium]
MASQESASGYRLSDYFRLGTYFALYGIVKYLPSPVGDWLRYAVTKPFLKRVGGVRIYEGVTIWYPYRVAIGKQVTLNEWVFIDGFGGVTIGDGVRIAHRVSILSSDHNYEDRNRYIFEQGIKIKPTFIEDDVWLGANSVIMPGVRIAHGAIVGAGAVVTKDVPRFTIVGGVPARPIGMRGPAPDAASSA